MNLCIDGNDYLSLHEASVLTGKHPVTISQTAKKIGVELISLQGKLMKRTDFEKIQAVKTKNAS